MKNPVIFYAAHTRSGRPGRARGILGGEPMAAAILMLEPDKRNRADVRPPCEKTYLHSALQGSRKSSGAWSSFDSGRPASGDQQSTLFAPTASFDNSLAQVSWLSARVILICFLSSGRSPGCSQCAAFDLVSEFVQGTV